MQCHIHSTDWIFTQHWLILQSSSPKAFKEALGFQGQYAALSLPCCLWQWPAGVSTDLLSMCLLQSPSHRPHLPPPSCKMALHQAPASELFDLSLMRLLYKLPYHCDLSWGSTKLLPSQGAETRIACLSPSQALQATTMIIQCSYGTICQQERQYLCSMHCPF